MRLIVNPSDDTGASVPVRWCITPAERQALIEGNARKVFVLFALASENGRDYHRVLVPLEQEMAFISFSRPGTSVLHAQIVYAEKGIDSAEVRNYFIGDANDRTYSHAVLKEDEPGMLTTCYRRGVYVLEGTCEYVDVDPRFFCARLGTVGEVVAELL